MDRFNLHILSNVASEESLGQTEICLQLKINDKLIANGHEYPINPVELLKAKNQSGDFEIWTCSCGIAACAGISSEVNIVHRDGKVIWQLFDMPFSEDSIYTFDYNQYYDDITTSWQKFTELIAQYRNKGISFDIYPDPALTGLNKLIV